MTTPTDIQSAAATLGRKGGSKKSEAKKSAAQNNGALGGRPRVATFRRIAERLQFSVYRQGNQWILSGLEDEPLHYSIKNERAALLVGIRRAEARGMLTTEETALVTGQE